MVRATKCARCQNYMILDYKPQPQDAFCPWCGKPFRYHRANISRQNFSKIRTIPEYLPKKPTILALPVALNLSVDETNNLLRSAGMALSNSNKQNVIVEYFLSVKKYNLMEINETLYKNGEPCLGNVLE